MVFESHHEVVLPPDKGTGIRPGDKAKKAAPGSLPAPREYQRDGEAPIAFSEPGEGVNAPRELVTLCARRAPPCAGAGRRARDRAARRARRRRPS